MHARIGGDGTGNIYDGVFRTIENDCRRFLIPFVNKVFHENYTGRKRYGFWQTSTSLTSRTSRMLKLAARVESVGEFEEKAGIMSIG